MKSIVLGIVGLAAAAPVLAQAAPAASPAPQAQHARIATRAELADHVRALFERLDRNRDGFVAGDEIERKGGHGEASAEHSGDHKRGHHGGGGMGFGRMFAAADANRDGKVSLQEATDAAYRHFDMGDVNRDGQLTPDERMQMRQRMHAGHGKG